MKYTVLALLAVLAIANAKTLWHQLENYDFENYKQEHRRKYETMEEEFMRRRIFNDNLERIKAHNKDNTKTWKEGVNHFTDRTAEELSQVLGVNKALLHATKAKRMEPLMTEQIDISTLPPNVDWRSKGILTAVKSQGNCGSCWTFATAETLEAYWALATGQVQDLSEQQILDCTPNPDQCGGFGGCGGGTVELAYTRIQAMGGISSEWTYPYLSYPGNNFNTCQAAQSNFVATVSGYTVLPSNQYAPLLNHVATVGPIAVSVDASTWFAYESGVFDGCNQTNPDLDHAVQLVGYGTDPKFGDYWLIRNSWSPSFGELGYIRIARPANPTCGTDLKPHDGDACKDSPPTVQVCGTCGILYDSVYPTVGKL